MAQYRKKPVVIDAVQFKGFDEKSVLLSDRPEWLVSQFCERILFFHKPDTLTIKTLEGDMICSINDWIIQGVTGELYPCKPDIFEMTYESVN